MSYKATPQEIRRIVDRADDVRAAGVKLQVSPEGEMFIRLHGDFARVLGPDLATLVAEYHEGERREHDLEVIIDTARERLDKLLNPKRDEEKDGFTPGLPALLDQLEKRQPEEVVASQTFAILWRAVHPNEPISPRFTLRELAELAAQALLGMRDEVKMLRVLVDRPSMGGR